MHHPLRCAAALAILALSAPAMAQPIAVECHFTTECFEAETCADADFQVSLEPGAAPGTAIMTSQAETVTGRVGGDDIGALYWLAETSSAAHLMSWSADGSARYSRHLIADGLMVSYLGSCEAAP